MLNCALRPAIFTEMVEADSVMSPVAAPPAPMNVMIGPILFAKISAAIAIQNEPDRSIEMEALLTTTGGGIVNGSICHIPCLAATGCWQYT